jgi:hypothetical protein
MDTPLFFLVPQHIQKNFTNLYTTYLLSNLGKKDVKSSLQSDTLLGELVVRGEAGCKRSKAELEMISWLYTIYDA